MVDDTELLDACWAAEVEHNDHRPLWDGDIDEVERWPRTSVDATDRAKAELGALRAQALDAVDRGSDLAPSLQTAADAARLTAVTKEVEAELTFAHPDLGLHSYLFWAVNDLPLRTAEHGAAYLRKLEGFSGCIDEFRQRLTIASGAGRAPIASHTARAIEKLDAHLGGAATADPLLEQATPSDLDGSQADAWRQALADAIADHVRPALDRLRGTFRDEVLPAGRSDDECGLLHQPGGEERYAELVQVNTASGITPEQVHQTGLDQVARLAEEYRELGAEVFGTSDLTEVFARITGDELSFHDADEVVRAAEALHARAEAAAPDWFARVPEAPCRVRPTTTGSLAYYSSPAADGSRPGVFFFNVATPQVWGPNLAATVFHEGVPGHHFQAALALEADDLHEMHRRLFLPAFGEGWALYTERLADEMGLYEDAVQRLGMLATDSLRACRLVVDTGLHAFGWSRERAIQYFLDNAPMQRAEVTAEVDRYIGMPGQATSYMMGRLAIERCRDRAAETLGPAFSPGQFHDAVLAGGMVSLEALDLAVDRWISDAVG